MRKITRILRNEGGALLSAVVISAVLAIAVAGLMGATRNTASMGADALDETKTFIAAEAGLKTLTGWVSEAVKSQYGIAGVGHPANIIMATQTPVKTNVVVDGTPFIVDLEIKPDPQSRLRHWLLQATTATPASAYSTTVEWIVSVDVPPPPGPWGNSVLWTEGNVEWTQSWNMGGDVRIGGYFRAHGGFTNTGRMSVGGNFYRKGGAMTNSGVLHIGANDGGGHLDMRNWDDGQYGSITNADEGTVWVNGDIRGDIQGGTGNTNIGLSGQHTNYWTNANRITTEPGVGGGNQSTTASRLEPPTRPIVTGSSINSAIGATTGANWRDITGLTTNAHNSASNAEFAVLRDFLNAPPAGSIWVDPQGNQHVVIRVTDGDHVHIGSADGDNLPRNVIFIVGGDGTNARLTGRIPNTDANNASAMIYVGENAHLGRECGTNCTGDRIHNALTFGTNFNGLIYVNEQNTREQHLQPNAGFRGAVYMGRGTYYSHGNASNYTFDENLLNRFGGFVQSPSIQPPPETAIVDRMNFRTSFTRMDL